MLRAVNRHYDGGLAQLATDSWPLLSLTDTRASAAPDARLSRSMPERLRLSYRARLPEGARSVARPHRWGNQFAVGRPYALGDETGVVRDRSHAVELFERWLLATPAWAAAARRELAGRHLACWCPLDDQPCHAQVLLRIANPGRAGTSGERAQ